MEFWQRRRRQYLAFCISLFINSILVFFLFVECYLPQSQQKQEEPHKQQQQQKTVYPRLGSPQGQQNQQQKSAPVIFQSKAPSQQSPAKSSQQKSTQKQTSDAQKDDEKAPDEKQTQAQQPAASTQDKQEDQSQQDASSQADTATTTHTRDPQSKKRSKQSNTHGRIPQQQEPEPESETSHDKEQSETTSKPSSPVNKQLKPRSAKNPRAKFFKNPEKATKSKQAQSDTSSEQQQTQTGGIPRPRHIPQSYGSPYGSKAEKKAMQFEHETFYSKCAQAIVRSSRELRHDVMLPSHVQKTVRVRFGITRARKNVDVHIITSSGHDSIDEAVIAIIQNASMPQLPDDTTGDMLYHTINIDIKSPPGTSSAYQKQPLIFVIA